MDALYISFQYAFKLPRGPRFTQVTRKAVSKNGATIAKAIFITVCANM